MENYHYRLFQRIITELLSFVRILAQRIVENVANIRSIFNSKFQSINRNRIMKNVENAKQQHEFYLIKLMGVIRQEVADKKIIIFPPTIDFTYLHQRPQQIAEAFTDAGFISIYGTLNKQADSVKTIHKVRDGLYLMHENLFPFLPHAFLPEEITYYCMWPNNRKHLEYLSCNKVCYDLMDDLSLLELPKKQIDEDHRYMLDRADLITVSAEKLMQEIPTKYQAKTILLPNAVSIDFIENILKSTVSPPELINHSDKKIIGYYGAIAKWFDLELVALVAKKNKNSLVVMIGPVSTNVVEKIDALKKSCLNLIVLPSRSQMELIPFLQRFDLCIIPFYKNTVTDAVSPVKLFEYMAAGKPIVTTDMPECRKYPSVRVCRTYSEFAQQIEIALNYENNSDFKNSQLALARNNTWQMRVQTIIENLKLPCSKK